VSFEELRARWQVTTERAAALANAHGGEKFGQSFGKPGWKLKTSGVQNGVGVFVGRGWELARVNGPHDDVIPVFGSDKISVGRGAWPIGLILAGGTECYHSNRLQALWGQTAFLKIKGAQLFKPN
jgi:hypothetical protein